MNTVNCPDCGEEMVYDGKNWCCHECGLTLLEDDVDGVPEGCAACGGDYPNCKDSCPMFD